jgi:HPt (histidine-containing phosphotransfer) domain-containing protein
MDGYLRKPVGLRELEAAVLARLPAAAELRRPKLETGQTTEPPPHNPDPAVLDLDALRAIYSEINAEARELLGKFLSRSRLLVGEIQRGLERDDNKAALEAAHALSGTAQSLGAHSLGQLCREIEANLAGNDDARARDLARELEPALARTAEIIRTI